MGGTNTPPPTLDELLGAFATLLKQSEAQIDSFARQIDEHVAGYKADPLADTLDHLIRTRTKVKGPFGVTLAKTKGWLLTPFDIQSGPIRGKITVDGE